MQWHRALLLDKCRDLGIAHNQSSSGHNLKNEHNGRSTAKRHATLAQREHFGSTRGELEDQKNPHANCDSEPDRELRGKARAHARSLDSGSPQLLESYPTSDEVLQENEELLSLQQSRADYRSDDL